MSVVTVFGKPITRLCRVDGTPISRAVDLSGETIWPDWAEMPADIRAVLDDAMAQCADYIAANPGAYAFPVVTDAHLAFSRREPAYISTRHPDLWSRFLFLGDMTQTHDAQELDDAVTFMGEATPPRLVAVGNHELSGWAEGDALPQEWYAPLVAPGAVMWDGGDGLVYYSDDDANNVRYIVLDSCTPIYKGSGVYLYPKAQLEWCASVMESAGGRDIVLCNHVMGTSFYLVTDTEQANKIADSTITNASTVLFPMIRAYIARETYTVTDDEGVAHVHDFSGATGAMIGYFAGHYHNAGYTNANGFNQFTSPTLGPAGEKYLKGMSFFVVDPTSRKIIWHVCDYETPQQNQYEYPY